MGEDHVYRAIAPHAHAHASADLASLGRPAGETVSATRRGAIRPASAWVVEGWSGPHNVGLDCGRFGRGPISVTVDGAHIGSLLKPTNSRPWSYSPPIAIGGRQVVVYAESVNDGDLVTCDLYVDGRSIDSGDLLEGMQRRGETVTTAASSFVSPRSASGFRQALLDESVRATVVGGVLAVFQLSHGPGIAAAVGAGALLLIPSWIAVSLARRLLASAAGGGGRRAQTQIAIIALLYVFDVALVFAAVALCTWL